MNLPHLEYLNMSYNQIKNIEPIAKLNSQKLKEICLQNNLIKDLSPLLKSDFLALERLRIENNIFDINHQSFIELINNKYKNRVFYRDKTSEDFNEKYGIDINIYDEILELSNLKGGDDLLLDLYLIIRPDNNIKQLKLDDNQIKNASLISRIPLYKLKILDLSLNNITNIKFLTEMKSPRLNTIYLNCNQINDIYPLIQITDKNDDLSVMKYPNLSIISLKENNFRIDDKKNQEMIKKLIENGIELDLDI